MLTFVLRCKGSSDKTKCVVELFRKDAKIVVRRVSYLGGLYLYMVFCFCFRVFPKKAQSEWKSFQTKTKIFLVLKKVLILNLC